MFFLFSILGLIVIGGVSVLAGVSRQLRFNIVEVSLVAQLPLVVCEWSVDGSMKTVTGEQANIDQDEALLITTIGLTTVV